MGVRSTSQGTHGTRGTQGTAGPQGWMGAASTTQGTYGNRGTQGLAGATGSMPSLTASTKKGFLIGKSSASTGWDGTYYVNGSVWFSGSSLYASSDERLKEIKGFVDVKAEDIAKIRKIYYTYLSDENANIEVGVIAQDIQKICPELVGVGDDGYLSVCYDKLSILALSAIDDLHERVTNLEEKIK
jgi:hypothetical protein